VYRLESLSAENEKSERDPNQGGYRGKRSWQEKIRARSND